MSSFRLKQLRESAKKTIPEVAKAMGTSVSNYLMIEDGQKKLSSAQYLKRAQYFRVSIEYLMGAELPADYAKTDEERELLELFRGLSPYLQDLTLTNVRSWSNTVTEIYIKNHK